MNHYLLIFILSTITLLASAKDYKIDVAPGGEAKQIKNKFENYPCRFYYQAQGGTNEEWIMSINKIANSENYSCKVYRPSATSYLFFEHAKIKGCKMCNIVEWTVLDNAGPLDKSVFSQHKNMLLSNENFKNEIASFEIVVELPKDELWWDYYSVLGKNNFKSKVFKIVF